MALETVGLRAVFEGAAQFVSQAHQVAGAQDLVMKSASGFDKAAGPATAAARQLTTAERELAAQAGRTAAEQGKLNTATSSSGVSFTKLVSSVAGGNLAFAAINRAFGTAKDAVIGMNSQLETSQIQFEVLFGSADRAREHVAMLFEFAKKTPFETGPIIEASRQLQTFGGDALNTTEMLTLLGDAAAGTSRPFNEVAFWVGRMYAAIQGGQPFGEAAMRLTELAILTPKTRQAMEDLQKAGGGAAEIFGLLEQDMGRFTGGMEKQAGTWTGVTSTFSDTISILAADVMRPFFELLRDSVGAMNQILGSSAVSAFVNSISPLNIAIVGLGVTAATAGPKLVEFAKGLFAVNEAGKGFGDRMIAQFRTFPGVVMGVVAAFTALDVILRAITGEGLVERIMGFFNRGESHAEKLEKALEGVNRQLDLMEGSDLENARTQLEGVSREIERIREEIAEQNRLRQEAFGYDANYYEMVTKDAGIYAEKINSLNGELDAQLLLVEAYAQAQVDAGADAKELVATYESLPPSLRKTYGDVVNIDTALEAVGRDFLTLSKEQESASLQFVTALSRQVEGLIPLNQAWADYQEELAGADDKSKFFQQTINDLTSSLSNSDPAAAALRVQIAVLDDQINDITSSTSTLTEEQQALVDSLTGQKEALENSLSGYDANAEGINRILQAVQPLIGEGALSALAFAIQNAGLSAEGMIDVTASLATAITEMSTGNVTEAIARLEDLKTALGEENWLPVASALGPTIMGAIEKSYSGPEKEAMLAAAEALIGDTTNTMKTAGETGGRGAGEAIANETKEGLVAGKEQVIGSGESVIGDMIIAMDQKALEAKKSGEKVDLETESGIKNFAHLLADAIGVAVAEAITAAEKAAAKASSAGQAFSGGVASGISQGSIGITNAAVEALDAAIRAANQKALEAGSPSKVTARELGKPFAQGIVVGIEKELGASEPRILGATERLIRVIGKTVDMVLEEDAEGMAEVVRYYMDVLDENLTMGIAMSTENVANMLASLADIIHSAPLDEAFRSMADASIDAFSASLNAGAGVANRELIAFLDKLSKTILNSAMNMTVAVAATTAGGSFTGSATVPGTGPGTAGSNPNAPGSSGYVGGVRIGHTYTNPEEIPGYTHGTIPAAPYGYQWETPHTTGQAGYTLIPRENALALKSKVMNNPNTGLPHVFVWRTSTAFPQGGWMDTGPAHLKTKAPFGRDQNGVPIAPYGRDDSGNPLPRFTPHVRDEPGFGEPGAPGGWVIETDSEGTTTYTPGGGFPENQPGPGDSVTQWVQDKNNQWHLITVPPGMTADEVLAEMGFARGTRFVPRDMLAWIHRGEAIIPAALNPANGGNDLGGLARLFSAQSYANGLPAAMAAAGGGLATIAIDLSQSTFNGTPRENARAIGLVIQEQVQNIFGRQAVITGVQV